MIDYSKKTIEEMEARKKGILSELESDGADLDALKAEADAIKAELEKRKADAQKRDLVRASVAFGAGEIKEAREAETRKKGQTNDEIRNSAAYINAYANYIKTDDDRECRALLTENVTDGQLPVPTLVETAVRTAWENDEIMSRVRRTYFKGNLRVPFEISATGAVEHTEGQAAPTEEQLTLGIVTMIPKNIKKWIKVSDEVVAMGGETFLRYIYDELTYQIIKKLASLVIVDIVAAPAASTATAVGIPAISQAPAITTISTAAAHLSDEARNNVVIMNRLTEVEFIAAYAAGNFAVDPFAGLPRVYTTALPAYSAASAGDTYAIVGDLDAVQVNYPEGDGLVIKYDDVSLAESDMVKIVGRQYAAHAVTGPGRLVKINKA